MAAHPCPAARREIVLEVGRHAGRDDNPASFAHRCNALARTHVAPRRTLAVLASARNEGLYLLEWVAYHKLIGVERLLMKFPEKSPK